MFHPARMNMDYFTDIAHKQCAIVLLYSAAQMVVQYF